MPGFSGPAPLTYRDLHAYQDMTGDTLEPWEVEAVRALDDAYLDACREFAAKN